MTEFMQIIAETEGVRTPKKKRTMAEVKKAYDDHVTKKAAKKKAAKSKPAAAKKPVAPKAAPEVTKVPPATVEPIPMNFISPTGYIREAAFDPKTKMFHVAFAKSTWARPSTAEKWATFEKAVADPTINIDQFYRQNYKGTADMVRVNSPASEVAK